MSCEVLGKKKIPTVENVQPKDPNSESLCGKHTASVCRLTNP